MSHPSPPAEAARPALGLWMSIALVVGNMIASGIFLLPAALAHFGGISIVGWLFTTAGAVLLALVLGRLSRIVREPGGPYAYTRRGFGDFAGFLVAWGYWISIWVGNAAISTAFVGYVAFFWAPLGDNSLLAAIAALAAIWILTWVNARGVRTAGFVQVVTTVLKLAPLIAIGTLGLLYFNPANFIPFNASGESSFSAVTATAALTLWAFLGLESATIPSGEVQDPERTIPRATIIGTLITAAVYIAGTAAVMGVIPASALAGSTAPFADAASAMWGPWAAWAVAAGGAVACFGALNGWILLQGQLPLAVARDGLFPKAFGRTSGRGTPVIGLVVASVLVTLLMAANYTRGLVALFTFMILLATLTTLVPYIFSTLAELVIFVRERERFKGQRLMGASVIAALAFIYSIWATAGLGWETLFWGFVLLAAGVPVYVWLKRQPKAADAIAEEAEA